MSDGRQERPTSFAKSVEGLHHEESALDRARALRDQFTRAQEQNNEQKQQQAERPQGETEKSGSQMVRQDAPGMHLRPSGAMRAPDRQVFKSEIAKEHQAEDKKNEAAKIAQEFKARQGPSHDRENER